MVVLLLSYYTKHMTHVMLFPCLGALLDFFTSTTLNYHSVQRLDGADYNTNKPCFQGRKEAQRRRIPL